MSHETTHDMSHDMSQQLQAKTGVGAKYRSYLTGRRYDLVKKMEVADAILQLQADGIVPTKRCVAEKAEVGTSFALKIINELKTNNGQVIDPNETKNTTKGPVDLL